ncbi:GFA family protein [Ottowia sp.]|uniref:GFA family protein n=1 Tax=Ottowia sp. TaxID=1898956 RepID=UPI00345E1B76
MTTYTGSCHCGKVAFEVEGTIDRALSCNCSMCSRKGALLWFVPRASLRLTTPEDAAATYLFNRHIIRHRFCPTCGIHPYGEGVDPKGNAMAAVNLRCVEGLDLEAIPVRHFDGRSL